MYENIKLDYNTSDIEIFNQIPLHKTIVFWIAVGFLINSSGNFFAFIYVESSVMTKELSHQLVIIYSTVTISKNLILSFAFLGRPPQKYKQGFSIPDNLNLDDFQFTNQNNPDH